MRLANVTGLPSADPSAANRETMRGSNDGNAPTFSGVRCTNLPKPPRKMPRPSGSTLIATPARGDQLTRSTTASRSSRKPNSKETRAFTRHRSCANTANSVPSTCCSDGPPNSMRSASVPSRRRISTGRLTLEPS